MSTLYVPTRKEFNVGIAAYEKKELRGPVYFQALKLLQASWGEAGPMAEAIWLLLKNWHREFYRFGSVDLSALATCIETNMDVLDRIRPRDIASLSAEDEPTVKSLFRAFTNATRRRNKSGRQESTVATAKSLHLLSPGFLPLWDNAIAFHYGCVLMWSEDYFAFCWRMKEIAAAIMSYLNSAEDRTLLKRIDEFNYAVHTKNWVRVGSCDVAER